MRRGHRTKQNCVIARMPISCRVRAAEKKRNRMRKLAREILYELKISGFGLDEFTTGAMKLAKMVLR